MARVKGVKEKLHMPVYDAFFVNKETTFVDEMKKRDPRMIRFFVDVQNKTRLETNLQAAGVLPSLNTFEARAMRVVVSPPPPPPADRANGTTAAELLADLIYNSVTTLLVGEKAMIEVPTFWFPAGAGVTPGDGSATNHGEADPMATFRFAEPVIIEPQQNFRVEMLFPQGVPGDAPTPTRLAGMKGPFRTWVVLDGYLTRDVQ